MSQIPALFNPSSHSNYKIDATHANNRSEEPVLNIIEDAYQIEFYKKDHANFICKDATRGNSIYSILKPAKNSTDFKNNALRTSETGYELIDLEISKPSLLFEEGLTVIKALNPRAEVYAVPNTERFQEDLVMIEKNHCQKRSTMRIGIVCCKPGQKASQMLENKPEDCSPLFWSWVDSMAKQVDLEGWKKYAGDMRAPAKLHFDEWHDIQVAYHVAPNLNAEERRRLIGNDIALLVFLDAPLTSVTTITTALTVTTTTTFNADAQFDVNCLDAFGDVTQLYVIVQPIDGYPQGDYRVGFCSKRLITTHLPAVPIVNILSPQKCKPYLD